MHDILFLLFSPGYLKGLCRLLLCLFWEPAKKWLPVTFKRLFENFNFLVVTVDRFLPQPGDNDKKFQVFTKALIKSLKIIDFCENTASPRTGVKRASAGLSESKQP